MSPSEYQELITFLGERFETIDRRFEAIDRQLGELRGAMLGHFDELYRRLERLEQEYTAITQALRRIEARLADEGDRRGRLERDLALLRENVALLQARIEGIEGRLRSS